MNPNDLAQRALSRLLGLTNAGRVRRIQALLAAPLWDHRQPRILELLDIAHQRKEAQSGRR